MVSPLVLLAWRDLLRQANATISVPLLKKDLRQNFTLSWSMRRFAMMEATKIREDTAAVDKEWNMLKNLPARDVKPAKPKAEIAPHARKKTVPVHFASFMAL